MSQATSIPPDSASTINEATAKEILRLAEIRLAATLTVGIAQDQRATNLTSFYGAAAIAIFGAAQSSLKVIDSNLALAGSITAGFLFLASAIAARSAASNRFHIVGLEYRKSSKFRSYPVTILMDRHAQNQDIQTEFNLTRQRKAGFLINLSIWIGSSSAPLGALLYFVLKWL